MGDIIGQDWKGGYLHISHGLLYLWIIVAYHIPDFLLNLYFHTFMPSFSVWDTPEWSVLPPLITADFFEGRAYGSIFGTIFLLNSVGGAFGTWFCGFLHDHMGSYIPFFIIAIACAFLACFNIWIAAPRKIRMVPGKKALRFNRNSTGGPT